MFCALFQRAGIKAQPPLCEIAFAADMSMLWLHCRSTPVSCFLRTVIINKCCLMQRDMKAWQHPWITPPHILWFDVTCNQTELTAQKWLLGFRKKGNEDTAEEPPGVTYRDLHFCAKYEQNLGPGRAHGRAHDLKKWDQCMNRSRLGFYHLALICVVFCHQNKDVVFLLGFLFHVPELGVLFLFCSFVADIKPWMSHTGP